MSSSISRSRKRSRPTSSASSTRTAKETSLDTFSTIYNPQIPQLLIDHGIYGPSDSDAPSNLAAIQARMNEERASLSPSRYPDSKWEDFVRHNDSATNEADIIAKCVPYFTSGSTYPSSNNTSFCALAPLVTSTKMPPPKPDVSFGVAPKALLADARHDLSLYVVPTKGTGPVLVNDFIEVKGPDGTSASLITQTTYNGAAGARAVEHARNTHTASEKDHVARTFYTAIHGGSGTVSFYATNAQAGHADASSTYHTNRVAAECVLGSPAQLQKALKYHHNLREMAAEERIEAVTLVNSRYASRQVAEWKRTADKRTDLALQGEQDGLQDHVGDSLIVSDDDYHHVVSFHQPQ